ncbi:MAG: LCP family protein [Anaerolineales bacterium]|nr:LCP family protein [Anaerolineales bacterium]
MRAHKAVLALSLLMLSILACVIPGLIDAPGIGTHTGQEPIRFISAPLGATPTPTPFQPLPPTPTYLPTSYPTLLPSSTPASELTSGEGGPVATLAIPGEQINILLLGSDQRPYEGGFRTDTIILVNINLETDRVSMTSFPRDLYVYIPGWTYQRINTAMGYGGFPLLAETLEYNFGVRPEYYVMVNFWAFVQTIDSLGGITVNAGRTLSDHRDGYGTYTVSAGPNWMDGETALWYARARYTSSDFDRGRRQQEIIRALFDRLLSLDAVQRAPELYDIYSQNVTTDLGWQEIAPLLPIAARIGTDSQSISQYYIGPAEVIPWTTPGGAQVLLPRETAIRAVLQQALGNP